MTEEGNKDTLAGSESSDYITLAEQAQFSRNQGRDAEAETLYQRALAICEKTLRAEHPDISNILYNLALLYQDQQRYEEAETCFLRSLAIDENILGPEASATGTTLYHLAELYSRQGRYKEAEPLYQRALMIREKTLGPELFGSRERIIPDLLRECEWMLYTHEMLHCALFSSKDAR